MATKTIHQKPRTTDTIVFQIRTPDANGEHLADPWKVSDLKIYFLERDFLTSNFGELTRHHDNDQSVENLEKAKTEYRRNPNDRTLHNLQEAQVSLEATRTVSTFYYKDSVLVHSVGDSAYPAWLSSDTNNAQIKHVTEDANGNSIYGEFSYEWRPQGSIRAGDYIICWTWMPNASGGTLATHEFFHVEANPSEVITTPAHLTKEGKYETLLEHYLPEMYKSELTDRDLTPLVTKKLNESIADGFTFLEDMANQIVDLFDANALHESLLMYLSNLFNLKLKSDDPTLWRRQIKEAIPLFKKKGTLQGLKQAFTQAGMVLNKYTQYWQVVSPYTWQESFRVTDSNVFKIEKNTIQPIDPNNFGVWLRRTGEDEYVQMPNSSVEFASEYGLDIYMTWVGEDLFEGDIIRILYQYRAIPNSTEQSKEDYILSLPLSDSRNEADFLYPPKNWNVRLISEEDPMFDVLIPVRHPFADPLIFGHIRTEFAYSENIYNMDEYNGSIRPSLDVCHIDADFTDPCGACLSSTFSVDVGIENLANDRMLEAQEILSEYMPFHATVHTINFSGELVEFIPSPFEQIEALVSVDRRETILSGQANSAFHRAMEGGLSNWAINRDALADQLTVCSGGTADAYNEKAMLIVVENRLSSSGVIPFANHLKVLAPSPNAGTYKISSIVGNTAVIESSVSEPLNASMFTFDLSNILYSNTVATITQEDLFKFSDSLVDFAKLGVKTTWDLTNTPTYSGNPWKLKISAYSDTGYQIRDIRNGVLYIDGDSNLPTTTTSSINYQILDGQDELIQSGTTGVLTVERQGKVDLNDDNLEIDLHIKVGDYFVYNDEEFQIAEIRDRNLYISGWTSGGVGGAHIHTRRRVIENGYGYFGYRGMYIETPTDHESEFEVSNGENPPSDILDNSTFKENFLVKIGEEFYRISYWNGKIIKLIGRYQNWPKTGTAVSYDIVHFSKKSVNVQWLVFDHLDRDGHDVVVREIFDEVSQNVAIVALESSNDSGIQENVAQEEGLSFVIDRKDGSSEKGDI